MCDVMCVLVDGCGVDRAGQGKARRVAGLLSAKREPAHVNFDVRSDQIHLKVNGKRLKRDSKSSIDNSSRSITNISR